MGKMTFLIAVMAIGIFPGPSRASEKIFTSLKLGFTSGTLYDVDVNDARAAQEIWMSLILENVNQNRQKVEVKTMVYPDVSAAGDAIAKNEIDAVIVLPLEYLALREKVSVQPIMTSRSGDEDGDHYVLVTHKQNDLQSLAQFESQSLIISIKGSNKIPELWLETLLLQKRLPPSERFFSAIKRVEKTTQAVLPVFFKQSDVCLVPKADLDIAMELNPQLKAELRIIQRSTGFNRIIICMQDSLYQQYGNLLGDTIEVANQTKQGRYLFTLFRVSSIARFEEGHLDNIKNLVHTYQTLIKTSLFPQTKFGLIQELLTCE